MQGWKVVDGSADDGCVGSAKLTLLDFFFVHTAPFSLSTCPAVCASKQCYRLLRLFYCPYSMVWTVTQSH